MVQQVAKLFGGLTFAPPAGLAVARPQPPCVSLRSGGGQTWRWVLGRWPTGWLFVGLSEGSEEGRFGVGF